MGEVCEKSVKRYEVSTRSITKMGELSGSGVEDEVAVVADKCGEPVEILK